MKNSLAFTGLPSETVKKIQQVFSEYPEIERVCLYGSRAKGDFQNGSDIDLTIMGDALSSAQLLRIENDLDELLMPYKIDLSLYRQIENINLVEHIRRVGVEFYFKRASTP